MKRYEKEKDWAFRQNVEKFIIVIVVVGLLSLLVYNIGHSNIGRPFTQFSEQLP